MSDFTNGFFDSQSGDRVYNSEDFRKFTKSLVKDGIAHNGIDDEGYEVFTNSPATMSVNIRTGHAIIQGAWRYDKYNNSVTIQASPETYSRYDAVVIQFSSASRSISFDVVHGTQAQEPEYPEISTTEDLTQFVLAWIHVRAGVTGIEASDVIDARGTSYCPWLSTDDMEYMLEHYLITHPKDTQVGSPTRGTYVDGNGNVQRMQHELKQDVLNEYGSIIYSELFPKATGGSLGGVIVGDGLRITENGVLSVVGGGGGGGGSYDEERLERCEQNILALYFALELETQADIQGMADNFVVETFDTTQGYYITSGIYDSTNHRVYA